MKRVLVLIVVGLLAGCAPKLYSHPTKTAQEFERDQYDCKQYVMILGDVIGARGHMQECLEKKHGWREVQTSP